MMKITLLGAAGGEVTGSAYLLQTNTTSDLLNWFGALAPSRPRVILTHGEDGPRSTLRARLHERFGLQAEMPGYRDLIEF